MRDEIGAATTFLCRLARRNKELTEGKIGKFGENLKTVLENHYENHWHEDVPERGQGFRCLRVNAVCPRNNALDEAAKRSGIKYEDLALPQELTVWVDPGQVSCRFGENSNLHAVLGVYTSEVRENKAMLVDIDDLMEAFFEKERQQTSRILKASTPDRSSGTSHHKSKNHHNHHHLPQQHPNHHHQQQHHHHQQQQPHAGSNGTYQGYQMMQSSQFFRNYFDQSPPPTANPTYRQHAAQHARQQHHNNQARISTPPPQPPHQPWASKPHATAPSPTHFTPPHHRHSPLKLA